MPAIVFDIETSALSQDHFDETQLEYLFRPAEKLGDETERDAKREEIERQFNLWPLTAQCVCIAMINPETNRGKVLYLSDDADAPAPFEDRVDFMPFADESELLHAFWELAEKFDRVISFNGRGFDVPFLYLRSAVLNVPITKKNWLGYRFSTETHCDLAEQLTFYNVSGWGGAARRFNLDFYCKVFGIPSPKAMGVTGMDVNDMMNEGRYNEIAEYCIRDVDSTVQLFKVWQERLEGIK